jgi:DNA-binding helix-hairpin-helix protein with protein kinase domain
MVEPELGVSNDSNLDDRKRGLVVPSDSHRVVVKLSQFTFTAKDAVNLKERFPEAKQNHLNLLSIFPKDGTQIMVEGFGIPFANGEQPQVERWVNGNYPIVDDVTPGSAAKVHIFQRHGRSSPWCAPS